jgi:hypothetical protein
MIRFAEPFVWTFIARARTGLMFDRDTADQEEAMLFILIPAAWLFVLALIVAVCRTAADADRSTGWSEKLSSAPIGPKLTLANPRELPPPARRPHSRRTVRPASSTRRARPAHVHH